MSHWVKLTPTQPREVTGVWVNLDEALTVQRVDRGVTEISFGREGSIDVEETPDEVMGVGDLVPRITDSHIHENIKSAQDNHRKKPYPAEY